MRYIINDHVVLQRAPEGPLAPYVAPFSNWASEQALAKTSPPHATPGRYRPGDRLLNFLDNL